MIVRDVVTKVRSKNAGPFWLTIDIFCGTPDAFARIRDGLSTDRVATALATDPATIKRFDIAPLHVVKFSLPRPTVQGALDDRDMHGAGWAPLIAELDLN
ncbi:hypothetical protein AN189_08860 [Loktanella sp. 3ANDIMAR09]|uniref:DUF4387 family protein n=1 Tax=Loktanella sp. 3ANDIMAR09 TaxID=1225657 RepID=UPI0006FBB15F|nr:DUF4387 family protein [Loktanella sp. 3ANDIMAR09]KQI68941.1 hypothetical protein AN189_08860 [Loktanella sp. 3ANDIMAR09]